MIDGTRLDRPLLAREFDELGTFLVDRCMSHGGMPLSMLDGYLTAIVSCPEAVLPSTWLPAVWEASPGEGADGSEKDGGFAFASREEAQRYSGFVMRLMNEIARNLAEGVVEPIFVAKVTDDGGETELANIWCAGYVAGMGLNRDAWNPLATRGSDAEKYFIPIFALASPLLNGDDDDDEADADALDAVMAVPYWDELTEVIPTCVGEIYECSLELRRPVTVRRPAAPSRNTPCPCGSGRKYKKCCGRA